MQRGDASRLLDQGALSPSLSATLPLLLSLTLSPRPLSLSAPSGRARLGGAEVAVAPRARHFVAVRVLDGGAPLRRHPPIPRSPHHPRREYFPRDVRIRPGWPSSPDTRRVEGAGKRVIARVKTWEGMEAVDAREIQILVQG